MASLNSIASRARRRAWSVSSKEGWTSADRDIEHRQRLPSRRRRPHGRPGYKHAIIVTTPACLTQARNIASQLLRSVSRLLPARRCRDSASPPPPSIFRPTPAAAGAIVQEQRPGRRRDDLSWCRPWLACWVRRELRRRCYTGRNWRTIGVPPAKPDPGEQRKVESLVVQSNRLLVLTHVIVSATSNTVATFVSTAWLRQFAG